MCVLLFSVVRIAVLLCRIVIVLRFSPFLWVLGLGFVVICRWLVLVLGRIV